MTVLVRLIAMCGGHGGRPRLAGPRRAWGLPEHGAAPFWPGTEEFMIPPIWRRR